MLSLSEVDAARHQIRVQNESVLLQAALHQRVLPRRARKIQLACTLVATDKRAGLQLCGIVLLLLHDHDTLMSRAHPEPLPELVHTYRFVVTRVFWRAQFLLGLAARKRDRILLDRIPRKL